MKTITVRVRPGAKKTCIKGTLEDGSIKVDVKAPPEDGKANAELIRFLADEFGVSVGDVEVVSGHTGRIKVIRMTDHRSE